MSSPNPPQGIPTGGKNIDLRLLGVELTAANVAHSGLSQENGRIYTYAADGTKIDLAPYATAVSVVGAHTAPPLTLEFAGVQEVSTVTRTTDDQFHEVFRFSTQAKHVYRATFQMTAIDAGNGTTKDSEARMTFKATASSLTQVGATALLYNAPDVASSSWAIQPSVQGTDLVISIKGALNRTIDWILMGSIAEYAPEGLT